MDNLFDLENKSIVIFGGRGYLGTQFTEVLLKYGAIVHSVDIKDVNKTNTNNIEQLKTEYPNKLCFYNCNATNKNEIEQVREEIKEKGFQIDVLINAITQKGEDFYKPFEKVSLEGWKIGINGNLTAAFLACQVFVPDMVESKQGSIINISSIYGIVGNDQRIYRGSNLDKCYLDNESINSDDEEEQIYSHPVYPAAKGGVIALTKYLAAYYGKYNVRVNAISPGGVSYPEESESFIKNYSDRTPLGRKARPDEINGAIIFLSSRASSYVTGHNLVVDGGWTIW
ncbi:SDR family oxidoreductase [Iocasia frigidifontis]|uniref:SDR family oxidoreductase n=1 Tax=Iocasia fonsfrigidae TaxID=2682810 RepID=A0A8A7KJF8_9FIRM|nr:SDR family oxidoreductase [Iocasia fonsfrigidae]QTL99729.1 SDR family oxidoreductase [Iocasia fonsfrigidae]